eukprot:sb/3477806/
MDRRREGTVWLFLWKSPKRKELPIRNSAIDPPKRGRRAEIRNTGGPFLTFNRSFLHSLKPFRERECSRLNARGRGRERGGWRESERDGWWKRGRERERGGGRGRE